ncbi:DNA ligase [Archaeoglobales archaeon]|nr:MAG: DNA ligase [Archaeoglobales archaeon]
MTDWFYKKIYPMLAVKGEPFSDENFIYEIKWDGTRCLAYVDVENGRIRLQNRRLIDITYRYPELDFLNAVEQNVILDGEIVVLKEGKPSFRLLQKREHVVSKTKISLLSKLYPAVLFAFDVLYDGEWLLDHPLIERKKILSEVVQETNHVLLADYVKKEGEVFYNKVTEVGLEGIIAKKVDSRYEAGKRSENWIKIKKRNTVDCTIVGWLEGEGRREGYFGSLVLALKDNNNFVHIGQVGTGFDDEFVKSFYNELRKVEIDKKPKGLEKEEFKRKIHWVKPIYVCEVEFLEITKDGKLRAPVFLRLRDDKSVEECTVEQLRLI